MTLSVPNQGIDPAKTREAVNTYCLARKITTDRLALILELNSEVYDAFLNGSFTSDGRLTEALLMLYWITGLDEADPVLYGVPSDQVSAWGAAHSEFITSKRRELYRVQRTAMLANAKSEASFAGGFFWVLAIICLFTFLLAQALSDNNPRTDGDAFLYVVSFVCLIFTPIVGIWWAAAHSSIKKFE